MEPVTGELALKFIETRLYGGFFIVRCHMFGAIVTVTGILALLAFAWAVGAIAEQFGISK